MVSAALLAWPQVALAQYASPNYRIEEQAFGTGGQNEETASSSYSGRASLGDLGVGNSASTSYQAYGGFTTTDEEYLEFIVVGGVKDFGELTTTTTGTGTAEFSVRSYLSKGYTVSVVGDPPTNNSGPYSLTAMSSTGVSDQGVEQFGINLRNNTDPDIGADPVQDPSTDFSFGAAATGYNIVDQFKYVNGDTIATSTKSTGWTEYTISMIANVTSTTPGGIYETTLSLVATPTF